MNRSFLLAILIAVLTSFGLTGCKTDDEVQKLTGLALAEGRTHGEAEGRKQEQALTDGKLAAALKEVGKIGQTSARMGGYSSSPNCNVVPDTIRVTQAAKDFPRHVGILYKEACEKEVIAMNGERANMKANAVAAAKRAEQKKLAAAKAAEAKKLAAAKAGKKSVKPAAHKGRG